MLAGGTEHGTTWLQVHMKLKSRMSPPISMEVHIHLSATSGLGPGLLANDSPNMGGGGGLLAVPCLHDHSASKCVCQVDAELLTIFCFTLIVH